MGGATLCSRSTLARARLVVNGTLGTWLEAIKTPKFHCDGLINIPWTTLTRKKGKKNECIISMKLLKDTMNLYAGFFA